MRYFVTAPNSNYAGRSIRKGSRRVFAEDRLPQRDNLPALPTAHGVSARCIAAGKVGSAYLRNDVPRGREWSASR